MRGFGTSSTESVVSGSSTQGCAKVEIQLPWCTSTQLLVFKATQHGGVYIQIHPCAVSDDGQILAFLAGQPNQISNTYLK